MNWIAGLILLFCSLPMFSQSVISGTVKDKSNRPLPFVNVYLKNEQTQFIIAFTATDDQGKYEFKAVQEARYLLQFSALNYDSALQPIVVTSESKMIEENIFLSEKVFELNEIVIVPEQPTQQKQDTIVFDVRHFITGNEMVVEDMLKKIPGITITKEGVIKVGNQEVEKVMVEGDDFFEKGYRLLTQSMSSREVDKVELYQHYSNNEKLRGIEQSEKVVLNLKLKENAKRQWFGNVDLGYGATSENRYNVWGNLMNFGKDDKYYFLTSMNNMGMDPIGEISQLINPERENETGSLGDGQSAQPILSISNPKPGLDNTRTDFNNVEMLSLNSILTPSDRLKIKVLAFFNADEQHFLNDYNEMFNDGKTQFWNTENSIYKPSLKSTFGKISLTREIDQGQMMNYFGTISVSKSEKIKDILFNNEPSRETLTDLKQHIDNKLVWTRKIKENKVLLFTARYMQDNTPQQYFLNKSIYQDLFGQEAQAVFQRVDNKMTFAGAEAHFLNRFFHDHLFEAKLGNSFRKDELQTHFELISKQNQTAPPAYQNDIDYMVNDLYLNLKYWMSLKKIRLFSQVDFRQLFNKISDKRLSQTQQPFLVNPKIGAEWLPDKENRITASYRFTQKNATVLEVSGDYVNTSFRNFTTGAADFNQLANSSFIISHTYGNWTDRFFTNTNFNYIKSHNFFSTETYVSGSFSQSKKIVLNGREFFGFSTAIDRYFKPIRCNAKLVAEAQQSNFRNKVNDSGLRNVTNQMISYGIELRSGMKGFFNYHIGFKNNHNATKTEFTRDFSDNVSFLDLYFVLTENADFQIKTERYYFGSLENKNTYYFLELEARYEIKKNKITFSLLGNNLLNTETFKEYSVMDASTIKSEYRLQPRYFLLSMKLNF